MLVTIRIVHVITQPTYMGYKYICVCIDNISTHTYIFILVLIGFVSSSVNGSHLDSYILIWQLAHICPYLSQPSMDDFRHLVYAR